MGRAAGRRAVCLSLGPIADTYDVLDARGLVEPAEAGDEPFRAGRLTIDALRQTVAKDGVELDLTQREFELIRFMSRQCGKVFSREELMREVWQYEYYGDVRAVDVAIRRLREKIEDDPAAPAILMTKRGAGYYLEG